MAPRSAPNAIRIPHLARAQADRAGDYAIDAGRYVAVHRLHAKNRRRSQKEPGPWLAIMGIVGDVRQYGLDSEPNQAVYLPQAADPFHYSRLGRSPV